MSILLTSAYFVSGPQLPCKVLKPKMLNLNIFRLYYYLNIKSHVKLISLCYVKMFTKKNAFQILSFNLEKKIPALNIKRHIIVLKIILTIIELIFFTQYISPTYKLCIKIMNFVTVIYSGVEKYITRKLSTSENQEEFQNTKSILSHVLRLYLIYDTMYYMKLCISI